MSGLLGALPYLMWANKPKDERLRDAKALANVPGGIGGAAQMYADTVQGGPSGLLGNVATYVTPAIVQGLLGKAAGGVARQIFAGEKAKTADKNKLKTAQELDSAGAPRQFIWDQTGWFKGTDGKWRFEIPDNEAKFGLEKVYPAGKDNPDVYVGMLRENVSHPSVSAAYPDTARIALEVNPNTRGASYSDAPQVINLGMDVESSRQAFKRAQDPSWQAMAAKADTKAGEFPTFDDALKFHAALGAKEARFGAMGESGASSTLHELQHAIQQREGFARGGSPDQFYLDASFPKFAKAEDLAKSRGLNWETLPKDTRRQITNEVLNDHYRRLAGEVEARNVQARMNMKPDERRLLPPWATMDIPESQQIVRGLLGD